MFIENNLYNYYQKNLLEGNRQECSKIVKNLLESKISILEIYENLFRRSLHDVGRLWEYNKISVAIEHMATSITESMINITYPYMFMQEKNGKKAIIACVSGEYHQIGSRMVADFFEIYGWDSYYVGGSTPTNELFDMIETKRPDILAISISIFFNMHSLIDLVSQINYTFPNLDIIAGGQAFNHGGFNSFSGYKNVQIISDIETLTKEILANESIS